MNIYIATAHWQLGDVMVMHMMFFIIVIIFDVMCIILLYFSIWVTLYYDNFVTVLFHIDVQNISLLLVNGDMQRLTLQKQHKS